MVNMNSVLKQMIEALNAPFVYSVTIQVSVVHLFACTLTCTIFLTLFSFTHFMFMKCICSNNNKFTYIMTEYRYIQLSPMILAKTHPMLSSKIIT